MRQLSVTVLALGLLGLVLYFVLPMTTAAPLARDGERTTDAERSGDRPAATADDGHAAEPSRTRVADALDAPAAGNTAAAPERPTLRGRCVAAEDGEPLAGVEVTLLMLRGERGLVVGDPDEYRALDVESDADGRFAFEFTPRDGFEYELTLEAELRCELTRDFPTGSFAEPVDLGDIGILAGADLPGRVVFEDGEPVGMLALEFQLERAAAPAADGFEHDVSRYVHANAEGRFRLRGLAPGAWKPLVGGGFELHSPARFDVAPGAANEVVVVVRRESAASIRGQVVAEDGAPLAGVYVYGYADVRQMNARSDQDGHFVLRGKGAPGEAVRLRPSGAGANHEYEPVDPDLTARWGDDDVVVRMRKPSKRTVPIVVVDAATGDGIEDYAIRCFPTPGANSGQSDRSVRLAGRHPRGALEIEGLREGHHTLVVLPDDARWAPGRIVHFETEVAMQRGLRIELSRAIEIRVRVQDTEGAPIADAQVELLRSRADCPAAAALPGIGELLKRVRRDSPAAAPENMFLRYFSPQLVWLLGAARTDADGRAALHCTAPSVPLALRASVDGHPAAFQPDPELANGGREVVLTIAAGARWRGRIAPRDALARLSAGDLRLALHRVGPTDPGEPSQQPGVFQSFELDESGEFDYPGLHPGRWRAMLYTTRQVQPGTFERIDNWLGEVELVDGRTTESEYDARRFLPGRIAGRVTLTSGAALPAGAHLLVIHGHADGAGGFERGSRQRVTIDAAGGYATGDVSPGGHRFQLRVQGRDRELQFEVGPWIVLPPDAEITHDVVVPAGALALTVSDAQGRPLPAGTGVALEGTARITGSLDANGRLIVDPAPIGLFRAHVTVAGETLALEAIAIPAGDRIEVGRVVARRP